MSGRTKYARNIWLTGGAATGTVRNMPHAPLPATWPDYARALGVELQRRRIHSGLTQEELAHRAGLTRTHYQQMERGWWKAGKPANPSIKVLARLAQVLDLEPGELLPPVGAVCWED